MPRSPVVNARMRDESRERILGAALDLFAARGFGGTSMRMIADAAGVSPGLIYAYFDGKDALAHALLAASYDDVQASFAAAEAEPDPRRRVRRLVEASFEILSERREFWRLSYGIRFQAAVLPGVDAAISEWQAEVLRVLTRFLRGAGVPEPADEARVLFGAIDGIAQHYVLDPAAYPVARVVERLLSRYE